MEPPHAHRPGGEEHSRRDHRRAGRQPARGPARPEPVPHGADAGRPRPRAVRLARHHRVPRRALPASAADAGRSGGARAVPARALSHRARLVQPGAADRRRRRSQAGADGAQDPARQHSRQHRRVQGEAVFPVGRVLAGGRHDRADPVAAARLGNRPAAAGAGHHASTRIWCSRGRRSATACRASSRRCALKPSADYGGYTC